MARLQKNRRAGVEFRIGNPNLLLDRLRLGPQPIRGARNQIRRRPHLLAALQDLYLSHDEVFGPKSGDRSRPIRALVSARWTSLSVTGNLRLWVRVSFVVEAVIGAEEAVLGRENGGGGHF